MTGDTVNKYVEILENQARPLIQIGVYKDEAAFLRDLVRDMAQRKIEVYRNRVKEYEKKHESWERFTAEIQGTATPAQEDEWMEWEADRDMLEAWQEVMRKLD